MKEIKKLQIGKNGLTEAFVEQARKIFEHEKIVKISILKSACRDKTDAKKIADDLVEKLGKKYVYRLVGYVISVRRLRSNARA